jgi:hypothetical protein
VIVVIAAFSITVDYASVFENVNLEMGREHSGSTSLAQSRVRLGRRLRAISGLFQLDHTVARRPLAARLAESLVGL